MEVSKARDPRDGRGTFLSPWDIIGRVGKQIGAKAPPLGRQEELLEADVDHLITFVHLYNILRQ